MTRGSAATDRLDLLPVEFDRDELLDFLDRWKVSRLALFGSSVQDGFGPESDIDVLVSFTEDENWSLFDIFRMEDELAELLGREVDLVEEAAVEQSPNHLRRKMIFESAELIYERR